MFGNRVGNNHSVCRSRINAALRSECNPIDQGLRHHKLPVQAEVIECHAHQQSASNQVHLASMNGKAARDPSLRVKLIQREKA